MTGQFEDVDPVRTFRWSRGERHFPGWYWAATTGRHVGFESWLERDRLLLMDVDPSVVGIGSQPFWLHWHDGERERRHAPDYFLRRADGSAVVVDIRADDRIEPKDAEAFEVTRLLCAQAGWSFERLGIPDAVLLANVRWLSRYRHPRCLHDSAAARLREVFAIPGPLMVGADMAGDRLRTLPVLFHLLWLQVLTAEDMTVELLGPRTIVHLASGVDRGSARGGCRRPPGSRSSLRLPPSRPGGGRGTSWRSCTVCRPMLQKRPSRGRSSTRSGTRWPSASEPRLPN
ncbi:TnsA-like heteromeric transposase endonuclease subunit [Streptomyces sp. NPDC050988]|uniref:TnsA-like heteromeric transposase endonuclease subunit n=1 Tax=Streptomyces sp. NPDC050988 TaxID=3365637 RepID=UPI00379A7A25